MRTRHSLWLLAVALMLLNLDEGRPVPSRPGRAAEENEGAYPSDWFGMQRAFPGATIPQERYRIALEQARVDRAAAALSTSGTLLTWTEAGPFNVGGRVTALAAAPGGTPVYLGSANGGVFKSANRGVSWVPIFDELGVYSIGALALAPNDPDRLYVGTGEANAAVDTYDGAGLFRTTDGGVSWSYLGLKQTARIARVAVDPLDPDRIYVAAMGTQFSTGPHRGLYRSTDGGASWEQALFVNDSTGVCEVAVNPIHPDTVFCATWERIRRPTYRRAYGPGSGIWRSTDRGANWTRLSTGLPPPSDAVGRIGLAIAPSRPSTIYAQIIAGVSGGYQGLGFYRSLDGGETWSRRDTGGFTNVFGGFGWYFGDCAVDPSDPLRVFALGVSLVRSTNAGAQFSDITGGAHVDQHALWIDPADPTQIYLGNDGGFYRSTDGGTFWSHSTDLPITQFYAGTIDPSNPDRLLGGTQDNNTLITSAGPSAWAAILGGDGFQCLVDPTNPNIVFAEYQYGSYSAGLLRSSNGGAGWQAPSGIDPGDRFNWNTPIAMSPGDHNVLLIGSQRVYRSIDNGVSYSPISGDLSSNPVSSLVYGTLTTLAISPVAGDTYFAGTDDGHAWRTTDGGANWTDISAGLPERWITRVTPDPLDDSTVYVTLSGFSQDEHVAHVYRSTDLGATWSPIGGNLPDAPVNDLVVDPADPQTLYAATDIGVYATRNLGAGWFPLGQGMPIQTVFDLTLHPGTRTLVAATHGRSQWKLDLNALPAAVETPPPGRFQLAPPRPNPSRGAVQLTLETSSPTVVEITIYDAMGRRVRALWRGALEPGTRAVAWDGTDARGRRVSAGVFYARASAPGWAATQRIVRVD